MSNELKSLKCPFCGHNSEKDNINPGYVFCTNPECRLHDMGLLESEWNTRPENPLQERLTDVLKQMMDYSQRKVGPYLNADSDYCNGVFSTCNELLEFITTQQDIKE